MIAIKGYRHGLLIVFNREPETPWQSHLRELEAKLDANPNFFRGSSVAFDVKDAALGEDDLRYAIDMLRMREVKLWAVYVWNGGQGSGVAAPITQRIYNSYFNLGVPEEKLAPVARSDSE